MTSDPVPVTLFVMSATCQMARRRERIAYQSLTLSCAVFAVQGPDLQNILRLSYDNAKVAIDLRRTSNLQNILRRTQGFSYVQFTCKIVRSSKKCS